jgi:hypothetical protein
MKYYIYKSKLIVPLVKELEIECSIKTIEVKGRQFERLAADFAFNQLPQEEAVHKLPISRQQALYHYLRLREQEFLYRNSCELWWKPKKDGFLTHETIIMSDALLSMVERELEVPKTVKVERFFWRKPDFIFSLC